jgi:hypothetical protein
MYVKRGWEINKENFVRLKDKIVNKAIFKELSIIVYKNKKITIKINHITKTISLISNLFP